MLRPERLMATAALAAVIAATTLSTALAEPGAPAAPETLPAPTPEAPEAPPTLLVALLQDKRLVTIDADQARVVRRVEATGIRGRLIGIDVRPQDGLLYGVDGAGNVYTIDPVDGSSTFRVRLSQTLPAGVRATVDFNPAADRLRIIGSDGTNLRADITTGTVIQDLPISYVLPNPFGGTTPEVIAGAYSNNVNGARATLLWDIDNATQALYLQIPPNNGVLNPVANQLGITPGSVGFDIETLPTGVNRAWLINGTMLHRLALVSGLAGQPTPIAGLTGQVRDLAVLP
jgi:hypothetical protein